MQDPEIQNILTDPIMRQVSSNLNLLCHLDGSVYVSVVHTNDAGNVLQVLMDFQENPRAAQDHLKDPGVAQKIQKLINAGIVQTR